MKRKEIGRFQTKDADGVRYVIVEYQTYEESNEIRDDRMSADPIIGQFFKTLEGRDVEQIDANSFQILGTNKIVRKI